MCEYPHVVVTGASSSTGRAVTLCLAASGYHVYAGVGTHASGVALHQHTPPGAGLITPLLLDVSRPIQVMAAVRAVTAHTGPGLLHPAVRVPAGGDIRDLARRTRPVAHRRHAHRARGGRRNHHPCPDRTPAASNIG